MFCETEPVCGSFRGNQNRELAQQWLEKLNDQWELQRFLQDCHEVGVRLCLEWCGPIRYWPLSRWLSDLRDPSLHQVIQQHRHLSLLS